MGNLNTDKLNWSTIGDHYAWPTSIACSLKRSVNSSFGRFSCKLSFGDQKRALTSFRLAELTLQCIAKSFSKASSTLTTENKLN